MTEEGVIQVKTE
ncbi:hypothetical protein E2320_001589, partial [Naja naja]